MASCPPRGQDRGFEMCLGPWHWRRGERRGCNEQIYIHAHTYAAWVTWDGPQTRIPAHMCTPSGSHRWASRAPHSDGNHRPEQLSSIRLVSETLRGRGCHRGQPPAWATLPCSSCPPHLLLWPTWDQGPVQKHELGPKKGIQGWERHLQPWGCGDAGAQLPRTGGALPTCPAQLLEAFPV